MEASIINKNEWICIQIRVVTRCIDSGFIIQLGKALRRIKKNDGIIYLINEDIGNIVLC